jgi:CDP-archaeol synthase
VLDWESNAARALLLLVAANATPLALARLFGSRGDVPLDLGCTLRDGRRLFGNHKTWRGFAGGTVACAFVAHLLSLGWQLGAAFGAVSLLGDATSSSLKRRFNLASGTEVPLVDQLPETVFPLVLFAAPLDLDLGGIALATTLFAVLDILAARIRHLARKSE